MCEGFKEIPFYLDLGFRVFSKAMKGVLSTGDQCLALELQKFESIFSQENHLSPCLLLILNPFTSSIKLNRGEPHFSQKPRLMWLPSVPVTV
ncbi:MAG: hypothetical protein CM1200mP12_19720 [Gammaproteobacteria bacterium]|nr:MAG: hypothetical protein CM1200mP12_19720 [Gammaproteobacteria bacterium]